MRLPLAIEQQFPLLKGAGYEVTSPETVDYSLPRYNCIAFAADDEELWWWPDQYGIGYWPDGVPREVKREAFIQAYETRGYSVCTNGKVEKGYEKIALYERSGIPKHAAKQQANGKWKSKLGEWHDIQHNTVEALHTFQGVGEYGMVSIYMRRKKREK